MIKDMPGNEIENKWPDEPQALPEEFKNQCIVEKYKKEVEVHAGKLKANHEAEIAKIAASKTAEVAQVADDAERRKNEYANYYTVFQAVQNAYLDAAKSSLENIQSRAQFVVTVSGALTTLYTALLGFVYTVAKTDGNNPLPERGIWAGVFFGASVVLAAVYYAYVTRPPEPADNMTNFGLRIDAIERVQKYVEWVNNKTLSRRYFLQAAIVSLGVGVAFLPFAFTSIDNSLARFFAIAGAVIVLAIPAVSEVKLRNAERR